jgi:hypothetical protein
MGVEIWYEKHQFILWTASIVLTVVLSLLSAEIRAIFSAAPKGILKVRHAHRTATLRRLEAYRDDPNMVLRLIATNGSISFVVSGLLGIMSMDRFVYRNPPVGSALDHLVDAILYQLAGIVMALHALLLGITSAGAIVIFIIWLYRDPEYRIARLRSLLERSESANRDVRG